MTPSRKGRNRPGAFSLVEDLPLAFVSSLLALNLPFSDGCEERIEEYLVLHTGFDIPMVFDWLRLVRTRPHGHRRDEEAQRLLASVPELKMGPGRYCDAHAWGHVYHLLPIRVFVPDLA
jgi:hypothetical protein